jgi:hypothetical protein
MFHYKRGQKEKKERLRAIIAQIKYETLTEAEKGFFNEMRTFSRLNYWMPSEFQIEKAKKLVKDDKKPRS